MEDIPVQEVDASSKDSAISDVSESAKSTTTAGATRKLTPKGNESQRRFKRQKIATGAGRGELIAYYARRKDEYSKWMKENEMAAKEIRKEWGAILREEDDRRLAERENVDPKTSKGKKGAVSNPFAGLQSIKTYIV